MTSLRIRPRFEQVFSISPQDLETKMKERLRSGAPLCPCSGTVIPGYIVLRLPINEQHFWSPQLSLSFEPTEDGKSHVRGLYGPNPTIWAMFTFGYAAVGIIAMFIAIIGLSQWSLGQDSSILWWLPVLGGAAVALYFIAQTGQKLGVEQTFTLHHFFEETIGERVHIH